MTADVKCVSKTQVVPIVYIRDVPEELHRRIRVAAATQGESMRAVALRALEREVERMEAEERKRRRSDK
jgi:plasmid stability protein